MLNFTDEKSRRFLEYASVLRENGLILDMSARHDELEKKVKYISYNSVDIKRDTLFVCKGAHFSGEYLKEALGKGAFAYISERVYEVEGLSPPYIIVSDIRKAMALLADFYYGQIWKSLHLVGITGTKGKSTTAYFVKYILDDYLKGYKKPESAIISSIDTYDGVIKEESRLTTPESMVLHRHFDNAVKSGIEFLTMEVSSQAVKYERTRGVFFEIGCFLNIGEDHISDAEHSDFEDYFTSKLNFFEQCGTLCVNLNSDKLDRVLKSAKECAKRVVTFGFTEDADIYGYDIETKRKGIAFKVRCDGFDREFKLAMNGLFNVENALAAITVCYALNIPVNNIYAGLSRARVSGRMEMFTGRNGNLSVIIDYAHNKMSFEALFASTQKEFPGKKIFIVFGCPGKKALGRRRELGEIAGKYAHTVFITEEDAGEEPVMGICEEIAKHVNGQKNGCVCEIITDREAAIKKAIEAADDDTVILITGKGRETRQKRGTRYVDTASDTDIVEKLLGSY